MGQEESFGNNEVEKLQCMRCSGDETNCGAVMLVRTRSKTVAKQRDDSGGESLDGPGYRDIEDSTINSASYDTGVVLGQVDNPGLDLVDEANGVKTVNMEANMIFIGKDTLGGTLPKSNYESY